MNTSVQTVRVSVKELHTAMRKAHIKPAMTIAGGGCGRPATILSTLHMSAMTAPSLAAVALLTAVVARSVPLCGSIWDLKSSNLKSSYRAIGVPRKSVGFFGVPVGANLSGRSPQSQVRSTCLIRRKAVARFLKMRFFGWNTNKAN